MDDMNDNGGNIVPGFPINFNYLPYAASFVGAVMLCCLLTLCCYLWRRIISPQHHSNSLYSSSSSFNSHQRTSQAQRQREQSRVTYGRRNNGGIGHQFVSWAREQMRNPVQDNRTPASNNLLSPMAAQYPRVTQGVSGGPGSSRNPGNGTTAAPSNVLSDSEGFSQATAPPPSYSNAVGYQNAPIWNLPRHGYGYQSIDARNDMGNGVESAQGGLNVLPPPYSTVVGNEQKN